MNDGPPVPAAHITGLPPAPSGRYTITSSAFHVYHRLKRDSWKGIKVTVSVILTSEISQFVPFMPGQPESGHKYHPPLCPVRTTYSLRAIGSVAPASGDSRRRAPQCQWLASSCVGSHGMTSTADDLKHLVNHYLYNPRLHVGKLRMRRRRTGSSNVLIVLEIDDTIVFSELCPRYQH